MSSAIQKENKSEEHKSISPPKRRGNPLGRKKQTNSSKLEIVDRITKEKRRGFRFKNQASLQKRGTINAKAIKNLKQMTLGLENGDRITLSSCKIPNISFGIRSFNRERNKYQGKG